jgi:hypothetical protein
MSAEDKIIGRMKTRMCHTPKNFLIKAVKEEKIMKMRKGPPLPLFRK